MRQGKVRANGSSSYSGSQIVEAQGASRERHLERFDMTLPANQQGLDVVEEPAQLAEQQGITLIEAIAFVINHPGVTSAIIGPRTMDQLQSQLSAAEVNLSAEVPDRIDELVAPGVTVNAEDNSYGAVELNPTARRR